MQYNKILTSKLFENKKASEGNYNCRKIADLQNLKIENPLEKSFKYYLDLIKTVL